MKKMISLLLALAMALSLVACGAGNDAQNDGAAGTDAAPAMHWNRSRRTVS